MKKLFLILLLVSSALFAAVLTVDPASNVGQAVQNGHIQGVTLAPDAIDGLDGTNGADGTNGYNGSNGQDVDSVLYDQLTATTVALSSVELNPDHEGLSLGLGVSTNGSTNAVAIGIMYGVQYGTYSVGYNLKAYDAEGTGATGVGAGVTLGF